MDASDFGNITQIKESHSGNLFNMEIKRQILIKT